MSMARGERSEGDNNGDDPMGLSPEQMQNNEGDGRKRAGVGRRRKRRTASARTSARGGKAARGARATAGRKAKGGRKSTRRTKAGSTAAKAGTRRLTRSRAG